MANYKFSIGDTVKIKSTSEYYSNSPSNPRDVEGKIYEFMEDGDYLYRVSWDNGQDNSYRNDDLELVSKSNFKAPEITEKHLKAALKIVCDGWQTKLIEWYAKDILINGKAIVTEKQYIEMHDASSDSKIRDLFNSVFPKSPFVKQLVRADEAPTRKLLSRQDVSGSGLVHYAAVVNSCNSGHAILVEHTDKALVQKFLEVDGIGSSLRVLIGPDSAWSRTEYNVVEE